MTKICFKCKEERDIEEFYKHSKMQGGYQGKCKICCRKEATARQKELIKDPEWVEKERARCREKYYRLNYRETQKPTPEDKKKIIQKYRENFPEKKKAVYTVCNAKMRASKGNNLHHWSYNDEHFLDVLELSIADHMYLHRFIEYDQEFKMYRNQDGVLLDSKQSHLDLLQELKLLVD